MIANRNEHMHKGTPMTQRRTSLQLHPSAWDLPHGQTHPQVASSSTNSIDCSEQIDLSTHIDTMQTLTPRNDDGAAVILVNGVEQPLGLPHRRDEEDARSAASTLRAMIVPRENHWVVRKRRNINLCSSGLDETRQSAALPRGCAWGIPIPVASPVVLVEGFSAESAMIRSIQNDNFKFLRHMICLGWMTTSSSDCNFSVTVDRSFSDEPEVLRITGGNPLHYAVCCNSLEAASALAIAFPELARKQCAVQHRARGGQVTVSRWTTLDFASYFCNVYLDIDPVRHEAFRKASVILLTLTQNPSALPFMKLGSGAARLAAAGHDVQSILRTFAALAD